MVHPALLNSLALNLVFGHLSVPELKSVRTVCKTWEHPASAQLSRRTYLNLRKVLGQFTTKSQFSEINLLLFRRIKIEDMPSKEQDKKTGYKKKCLTLLQMNTGIVEEIHFDVSATLGWIMKPALQKCEFPNIRKISVSSQLDATFGRSGYFPREVAEELCPNKLCAVPTITCLELVHHRTTISGADSDSNYPYVITFQRLLAKCPNLQKLKITGNIYLDLKSCLRLKSLEWEGFPCQPSNTEVGMDVRGDFNTKSLLKMLAEVNESLEECTLSTTATKHGSVFDTLKMQKSGTFKLPKFWKLKKLVLDPINGFTQKIPELASNQFPFLENITLNIHSSEKLVVGHLDELLTKMGDSFWTKVEELKLNVLCYRNTNRDALANLRQIGELFPNLKKLDVELFGPSVRFGDEHEVSFRNWWIELGNTCTCLEELIIRINCSVTLNILMEAIGGADFTALKTLRLVPSFYSLVSDERCICSFEAAFLAIPKIIFEGFQFNGNTVLNMVRFADHHKCNIYFYK